MFAQEAIELETSRVLLNLTNPGLKEVGSLRFLGGISIRSKAKRFGGVSGLTIPPAGDKLVAVTDRGFWLTAKLQEDKKGRLIGLADARMAPLLDDLGGRLKGKWRDAEAVEFGPAGSIFVSFERRHRIWRYNIPARLADARPTELSGPADLDDAPDNAGLEAMTVLASGEILVITEDFRDANDDLRGWLMRLGAALPITLRATGAFKPTDLTRLPNGDLVLLERRFSHVGGLGIRVSRIPIATVRPRATLVPIELAQFRTPLTIDNFEGIAATAGPNGETWLYLISDDNFSALQRTLLLKFVLKQ